MTTPVCDFVQNYIDSDPLRLHMPGHKGRGEIEALDITEIQGADPLYPAKGILRESEENAARLFGAARTLYSAEGSSLCIRAMVYLACLRAEAHGQQPVILAGRNAHATFVSVCAVMSAEVRWLRGTSLLTCQPTGEELEAALREMGEPPAAVYLTSPDYLGYRADIKALAEVCHIHGIPLMVDNAHGAYLRFLPEDRHPLSLEADLVCDSAHKTLPVLTGGAYLHVHREAEPLFAQHAERALSLFASTSPSWLILQSLDRCNAYLSGDYPQRLAAFTEQVDALKDRLRTQGYELAGEELLKITIAAKSYGYSGNELNDLLREHGMECEFSDPDYLVMMVTPETGMVGLSRLEQALCQIPSRPPIRETPPAPPASRQELSPHRAILASMEEIPVEASLGRVLASPCVSCPPAVPILMIGEIITEEAIRCFQYYGIETVMCINETPVSKRIGVAKGKLKSPVDLDQYNDEIAEMFGGAL